MPSKCMIRLGDIVVHRAISPSAWILRVEYLFEGKKRCYLSRISTDNGDTGTYQGFQVDISDLRLATKLEKVLYMNKDIE